MAMPCGHNCSIILSLLGGVKLPITEGEDPVEVADGACVVSFESNYLRAVCQNRFEIKSSEPSKQPIRTCYLDHVTGYQPIRDQYFLN